MDTNTKQIKRICGKRLECTPCGRYVDIDGTWYVWKPTGLSLSAYLLLEPASNNLKVRAQAVLCDSLREHVYRRTVTDAELLANIGKPDYACKS